MLVIDRAISGGIILIWIAATVIRQNNINITMENIPKTCPQFQLFNTSQIVWSQMWKAIYLSFSVLLLFIFINKISKIYTKRNVCAFLPGTQQSPTQTWQYLLTISDSLSWCQILSLQALVSKDLRPYHQNKWKEMDKLVLEV